MNILLVLFMLIFNKLSVIDSAYILILFDQNEQVLSKYQNCR